MTWILSIAAVIQFCFLFVLTYKLKQDKKRISNLTLFFETIAKVQLNYNSTFNSTVKEMKLFHSQTADFCLYVTQFIERTKGIDNNKSFVAKPNKKKLN